MNLSNRPVGPADRPSAASASRASMPDRPASATASSAFWSAFLGRGASSGASGTRPARSRPEPPAGLDAAAARTGDRPSVEPSDIARELGLSRFASVRALQDRRRAFALDNHPDRVPSTLRARATKRMMIANALIDAALARFRRGARAAPSRSFESGERV